MANWHYYNERGEKIGPIRGREFKQLARQGTITSDTRVENARGQTAFAKQVKGFPFDETESETTSTAEDWEEQDFEQLRDDFERLQEEQEQQQVAQNMAPLPPPAEENPFTAPMPEVQRPVAQSEPHVVLLPAPKRSNTALHQTLVGLGFLLIVCAIAYALMNSEELRPLTPEEHAKLFQYIREDREDALNGYLGDLIMEKFDNPPSERRAVNHVKYLVRNGADVHARDPLGNTPLHYAEALENAGIARYLISNGADVNAQNESGRTPHELREEKREFLNALLDRILPQPPNDAPGEPGEADNIPPPPQVDPPPDLDPDAIRRALINAVMNGIVREIEDHAKSSGGISRVIYGNRKDTWLHLAALNNPHVDVMNYLVSQGASVNAKGNDDNTPLHLAAQGNLNVEVLRFFLSRGAGVNTKNRFGDTPLHLAAQFNHGEMVSYLLSERANVHARNNANRTPLDVANTEEKRRILREAGTPPLPPGTVHYHYAVASQQYDGDDSSLLMYIRAIGATRFTRPNIDVVSFPSELNVTDIKIVDQDQTLAFYISGQENELRELARNSTERGLWRVRVRFSPSRTRGDGTLTADMLKIEIVK